MDARLRPVRELADAIESDGLSGLLRTLPRMTGQNGDFAQCVTSADDCMNDAGSEDEFWGCATGLAGCMRDVVIDWEPPEPPPPPPDDDDDDRDNGGKRPDLASVVLATFIFQLRRQSK
jgi:hypothetical protein